MTPCLRGRVDGCVEGGLLVAGLLGNICLHSACDESVDLRLTLQSGIRLFEQLVHLVQLSFQWSQFRIDFRPQLAAVLGLDYPIPMVQFP